jgi:hypothetical protein
LASASAYARLSAITLAELLTQEFVALCLCSIDLHNVHDNFEGEHFNSACNKFESETNVKVQSVASNLSSSVFSYLELRKLVPLLPMTYSEEQYLSSGKVL